MLKIIHILPVLFLGYIIYISRPGTSLFSLHPFCMALAYGLLMTESVLAFTNLSLWKSKSQRFYFHWLLNVSAAIFATFGLFFIYWNKNRKGLDHYVTYHGNWGFICVIYTVTQVFAGLFLKYPSRIPKFIPYKLLKKIHSFSGVVAYFLAVVSLSLGFMSTWFQNNSHTNIEYLFIILYGGIFLYLVRQVQFKVLGRKIF
ncbi:cytochrome b561 domain-containing protein 1 [Armadillidium vulgare]|nr:cytochrome b561 domain-containing protein 1 [Armadillidium vulgare]